MLKKQIRVSGFALAYRASLESVIGQRVISGEFSLGCRYIDASELPENLQQELALLIFLKEKKRVGLEGDSLELVMGVGE
jgi:hypothetical protein